MIESMIVVSSLFLFDLSLCSSSIDFDYRIWKSDKTTNEKKVFLRILIKSENIRSTCDSHYQPMCFLSFLFEWLRVELRPSQKKSDEDFLFLSIGRWKWPLSSSIEDCIKVSSYKTIKQKRKINWKFPFFSSSRTMTTKSIAERPSLLSSSSGYENYRGFLNLLYVILALGGFRLVLENILKYGLLVEFHWLWRFIQDPTLRPSVKLVDERKAKETVRQVCFSFPIRFFWSSWSIFSFWSNFFSKLNSIRWGNESRLSRRKSFGASNWSISAVFWYFQSFIFIIKSRIRSEHFSPFVRIR